MARGKDARQVDRGEAASRHDVWSVTRSVIIFRHENFQSEKNPPCPQVHMRLRYKKTIFHWERESVK